MLRIDFDASQANDQLDALLEAAEQAVRPAAQAGAQVFYNETLQRVPTSQKGHWFHGSSFKLNGTKYWFDAGTLRGAIYQVFSKDKSTDGKATYHIAWNHKKAPYGFMVEYGTSKAPATPFLRPAYESVKQQALQAANAAYFGRLKELINDS